jgi:hypothetical protein
MGRRSGRPEGILASSWMLTIGVAGLATSAGAIPVSPNLDPVKSYIRVGCQGEITTSTGNLPVSGLDFQACQIVHANNGALFQADGGTTSEGERPLVVAGTMVDASFGAGAQAVAHLYYAFTIRTKSPEDEWRFTIPISIVADAQIQSTTNSSGYAQVVFLKFGDDTSVGWNGNQFTASGKVLWRVSVDTNFLSDEPKTDGIEWFGTVRTGEVYGFFVSSACHSLNDAAQGTACLAQADPVIEFDQATFDEALKENTFPLGDLLEIAYSPGYEVFAPEPAHGALAALVTLLRLARIRSRSARRGFGRRPRRS